MVGSPVELHATVPLDKAGAPFWRTLLITLCLVGIALAAIDLSHARYLGIQGFESTPYKPYLRKVTAVSAGSPAARSGLRKGDILDMRAMSERDRYRLHTGTELIGQPPARVYVVTRSGLVQRTVGAAPADNFTWDVAVGYGGGIWMLLFAALLGLRCAERRDARTLALLLIGLQFWQMLEFNDWVTPWPLLDAIAAGVAAVSLMSAALLATYSMSFGAVSRLRQMLVRLAYAVAIIVAVFEIAHVVVWSTPALDLLIAYPSWTIIVSWGVPFVLPFLCGAVTVVEARGAERARFLWAFIPLAVLYAAAFANALAAAFNWNGEAVNAASNVAEFIAPLGLTYSLLNRRLLDIGFALNRAAIFSVVSIVIVGTFVLVEWLLSDWMSLESHSANIAVSAALALVLGVSMRAVHTRVEHFVDHVMFRKRRDDEEAIRTMAREAPYVTQRATLLARAEQVLETHAGASSVEILLDDERGTYTGIEENDPALVALRADHRPADLHTFQTAISGEWAFPMVARGRLVGALVLGPKRSGESYAPDEASAIQQLGHSLAGALDIFTLKQNDGAAQQVEVMRTGFAQLSAQLSQIADRLGTSS